jgi:trimeric autotransporter adhesin
MSSTKQKLRLAGAFTALATLALAVSCSGFFPNPTLTSLTINPTAPSVQVGSSITLQAFAVNSNNQGNYLTTGVSWSSGTPGVAQITGACANGDLCGSVTIQGVSSGTSSISAGSQSVNSTATLTVFLGNVSNFQLCMGTFGATTSCSSGTTPLTWTVSSSAGGASLTFIAQGTSSGTVFDLTTASTWTLTSTPTLGSVSCTNSGTSPETCTVASGTSTGTFPVIVSYGTNGLAATLNIVVTP